MINRRGVLRGLGGIAMAPTFFQSLAAEEATGASGPILVCIMLSGGNDGLNTVVPLKQYGSYVKLRTPASPPQNLNLVYSEGQLQALAFDPTTTTSPGAATQFGFAPGMDAMRLLYAQGHLAVVAGVGLPKAETNPLSHQNGQWDWLTGQINVASSPSAGWLGMTLNKAGAGSLGATASMGGAVSLVNGTTLQGLVINPPMDYFGVNYGSTDTYSKLQYTYHQLGILPETNKTALFNQGRIQTALGDIATIKTYAKKDPAAQYATPTYLDYQLRDIARLIVTGAGIRGFYAVQGGYDTHSTQALTQPLLLNQLSEAIAQFYYYLQREGVSNNVLIMTMSDFGRRPFANLNFGTDHGGGSVSFVLGDRVKGGVYGTYPSLTKFDQNQNLTLSVDFRNVLSDLIVSMGGNAATVLGQTWPKLGFI
jgi:uncharacterized protein (DUF1501 family)